MGNGSLQQRMLALLANYQQLVNGQLIDNQLVGEYLTDTKRDDSRLLCQMRTIIFLIKTARVLNEDGINKAEQLYFQAETHYLQSNQWLQKLGSTEEATLYSYAFVILAQGYLYQATHNPLYAIALAETFSLVEQKFTGNGLFKPLSELACLEQNAAMHLYEALTFAYYQADARYAQPAIVKLEQLITPTFWQPNKGLLAEKVSFTGEVLSYEAGHWFEWVTLLWRVKQWGGSTLIDPQVLYQTAVSHTTFTKQGLVLNEMDSHLQPQGLEQIRIWPNLEYLRAKTFIEQKLPEQTINTFVSLFFDQQGLPIEYLGITNSQGVKATTGYHIAESFIDILAIEPA